MTTEDDDRNRPARPPSRDGDPPDASQPERRIPNGPEQKPDGPERKAAGDRVLPPEEAKGSERRIPDVPPPSLPRPHEAKQHGTHFSRRAVLLCASVGALAVLAAGLVSQIHPSAPYHALAADCGRGDLVVAGGTDVSLKAQRRALIKQWNASTYPDGRPHRHARLVEVSDSTDLQHSQLAAVEQSGSCAYDVLIMDNTWTAQFAEAGYLKEFHGLSDTSDFNPAALRTGQWHGTQYAVPFNLDVGLLYYREGTTPPATWSALVDQGYDAQLADYEGLTVNVLEDVWNDGAADVLTGNARADEKALSSRVFPAIRRLATRVQKSLKASRQYQEQDAINAFASGDKLMRNWPYAFSALATEPRMRASGDRLRFHVAALPGHTVLGGQNLAVSAHSPSPGPSADLVRFLSGTAAQRQLFSCGGFAPARYSALGLTPTKHSPADVQARSCSGLMGRPPAPGDPDLPNQQQLTELGQAIVTALGRALPRPETEHYPTFSATFRDCSNKIIDGTSADADTFAHDVADALKGRPSSC
ncbi:extracellular solute-binding protein [Actinomadura oligospora]|uniref:extracellular solute-binding protein n=1 Tax=Actinomadura oligospora TaxID=111804 RepID=UPI0004AFE521|nr:extracellular solute-binding protein [Actinomadura oligospora]